MAGASESIGQESHPITVLSDDEDDVNPQLTNGKILRDAEETPRIQVTVVMSEPEIDATEEMVHVPGGSLLPRSKITNYDISNMIVKCTVCSKQLFHHPRAVKSHPHLDVVICKDCSEFYGDGNFSQDELGDKYCRWCAQGGKLNVCDFCTNAFCNECIRRNLGRSEVGRIKGIQWHCYMCASKPLSGLVNFCKMIMQYNKSSPLSTREKFSHKSPSSSKKKAQKKLFVMNGGQTADAPSDGDVSSDSSAPKCWLSSHFERTLHCMSRLCRKTKKLQFKANREKDSPLKVLQVADGLEKLLLRHLKHVKVMLNTLASDIDLKSEGGCAITGDDPSQSLLAGQTPSAKAKSSVSSTSSTSTEKIKNKSVAPASASKKPLSKRLSLAKKGTSSSTSRLEEIIPEPPTSEEIIPEPLTYEETRQEPSTSEETRPEPSTSEETRVEPSTSEETRPEPSTSEETIAEPLTSEDRMEVSSSLPMEDEELSSKGSVATLPLEESHGIKVEKLMDITMSDVNDNLSTCLEDVNLDVFEPTVTLDDMGDIFSDSSIDSIPISKKKSGKKRKIKKEVSDDLSDSVLDATTESFLDTTAEVNETIFVTADESIRDVKVNESLESKKVDEEEIVEPAKSVEDFGQSSDDGNETKVSTKDATETVGDAQKAESIPSEYKLRDAKPDVMDNSHAKELLLNEYLYSSGSDVEQKKPKPQKSIRKETPKPSGSSSESSSLEDFDVSMEKKMKRKTPAKMDKMEKEVFRLSQDDKIQGTISVVLKKLNESDVEGYLSGSMPLPEAKNVVKKDDNLDKEIERLSKMPKINKRSESSKQKKKVVQKKSPVKVPTSRAVILSDSSSSSSSSDSSDEDISDNSLESSLVVKKRNKEESINEAAKQALLTDDTTTTTSEGLDTSSDSDEQKGKKRPSRGLGKETSSQSDSEFEGSKKKKKTEKLLRAPINAPGEKGKKSGSKEDEKKTKKRKKRFVTDSDESEKSSKSDSSVQSASSSEEFQVSKPSKKRRRIKTLKDSSSEEDNKTKKDDNLPDTPSGKGRKNIRKLLDKEDLAAETRKATQAERERRKRIQERQKMFNQVTDFMDEMGESVTRKLVLDVDPSSKEILVEVDQDLVTKLKPHQVDGVKFMYLSTVESVQQLKDGKVGSGCILAHCMGLGKTLQVIAYVHSLLTNGNITPHLKTCLVVSPYNTVLNWATEFDTWQDGLEDQVEVHELTNIKSNPLRADVLKHWQKSGGVLIIGYDKYRLLTNEKSKTIPKKLKGIFAESLVDPGPDIVVCDEGHILKNEKAAISKAMTQIRTKRRIVLTGTPLQNNLQEYHCMVQFVKPHLLGQRKEFLNRFLNPITNGQCADSTPQDVKLMKKRVHILHALLEGCVQRCDYSAVTTFLPPKYEYVISVRLSEPQIKMYRHYLETMSSRGGVVTGTRGTGLFKDFNMLKLIWTHPYVLQLCKIRADLKASFDDEDSIEDFIDDKSMASASWSSSASENEVTCLDDPKPSTSTGGGDDEVEVVNKWKTRTRGGTNEKGPTLPEDEEVVEKSWWNEYIPVEEQMKLELSGKMVLLFEILKQCEAVGDKLLVFTSSILTLNMIEELLAIEDAKNEEENKARKEGEKNNEQVAEGENKEQVGEHGEDHIGTWVQGIDYFRMDGTTTAELRKRCTQKFNNPENERARLYLISTKAGSLGINLVGANRVIVMDASWNPTHDIQAIFRVFRFGQKKPVYIYRFLAQGTMEEKIYDRQVAKQSLACRVVDEQQIERHFNAADLAELYSFEPDSKSKRPTPLVPKDLLLAEMLMKQKEWIVSYHEHDSLLKKDMEEDLTEEERKVAWAEYEAEKEGRSLYAEQNNVPVTLNASMFNQNIDIQQMAAELRRKNPLLSAREIQQQLVAIITALLKHHQNRYHTTYTAIQEICKKQQLVPNDLKSQLGESYRMVHQLNQLQNLLKMESNRQANQQPPYVPQNRPQFPSQQTRPPIIMNNYRQQYIGARSRPVLYSRNLPPRGIYQDNLGNIVTALKSRNVTTEPVAKQPAAATAAGSGIIIEEMDENTPSPTAANSASSVTSTVVITEID